jgi:hypothetical protein
MSMKPHPTLADDPDAVPLPAVWASWTEESIERAMPVLLELAQIVADVAREKVAREAIADKAAAGTPIGQDLT